jgi:LPXTG-motif cell wall-anchored protein
LSSNNFRRGDRGNVQGCASPNSRVNGTLFSHPKPLGTTTADGTGAFFLGFTIPCDTEDGGHTLVVSGTGVVDGSAGLTVNGTNTAVCGQSAAVRDLDRAGRQSTVARRAASGGGGALPRTGSASTAPLTAAGIGLVLIGSAAVVVTRRRRSEAASATH